MQQVSLDYRDQSMTVKVPDSALVARYRETYENPPPVDPWNATRQALDNPRETPPLPGLARRGDKAVIVFPDRADGGTYAGTHRRLAIPLIVEIVQSAGVKLEDITLICATGLHHKNTLEEFYSYLGKEIVDGFWPDRLVMHSAEDPTGVVDLGTDVKGNTVTLNRLVAKADLTIIVGHAQGNFYEGYSYGYAISTTGFTFWSSIRCHHHPATIHGDDFLPANATHGRMRRQFDSIGRTMEQKISKPFFAMDTMIGTDARALGVYAGAVGEVRKASWPLDRMYDVMKREVEH